ncbi:MAG: signal peptidase II [Gracilibacteraceae bacterium]|nr:signal peptidase II [Gracilibacteraceae bacterium]
MYPVLIAAAVIALDQIIKNIMTEALASGPITVIKNFFYLVYVKNYGIAFGMFKNKVLFFIVTNCIISAFMAFVIYRFHDKNVPVTICLSLILGGAIGNVIDRIRLGYVVDYLSFTIFPPVFNLADSAIVVGALMLSLLLILNKDASI